MVFRDWSGAWRLAVIAGACIVAAIVVPETIVRVVAGLIAVAAIAWALVGARSLRLSQGKIAMRAAGKERWSVAWADVRSWNDAEYRWSAGANFGYPRLRTADGVLDVPRVSQWKRLYTELERRLGPPTPEVEGDTAPWASASDRSGNVPLHEV